MPRPPARTGAAKPRGVAVAPHRPRLTGRAAILVVVLAVLAVSYASSLRAYLVQRSEIDDLQSQISQRQQSIGVLEDQKARWNDPAYVETQARLLGYVMAGETPYSVQKDGQPLTAANSLDDPSTLARPVPRAWWDTAWDSVQVAGDPPRKADPVPPALITSSTP